MTDSTRAVLPASCCGSYPANHRASLLCPDQHAEVQLARRAAVAVVRLSAPAAVPLLFVCASKKGGNRRKQFHSRAGDDRCCVHTYRDQESTGEAVDSGKTAAAV